MIPTEKARGNLPTTVTIQIQVEIGETAQAKAFWTDSTGKALAEALLKEVERINDLYKILKGEMV